MTLTYIPDLDIPRLDPHAKIRSVCLYVWPLAWDRHILTDTCHNNYTCHVRDDVIKETLLRERERYWERCNKGDTSSHTQLRPEGTFCFRIKSMLWPRPVVKAIFVLNVVHRIDIKWFMDEIHFCIADLQMVSSMVDSIHIIILCTEKKREPKKLSWGGGCFQKLAL